MAQISSVSAPCPFCTGNVELPVAVTSEFNHGRMNIHLQPNLDPMYEHVARAHPDVIRDHRNEQLSLYR